MVLVGEKNCTAAEYKQLYEFTINYLRDTKKLHNLLIAYSPSDVQTPAHYLERYPGDGYVDVLGFDVYYYGDGSAFKGMITTNLKVLTEVARAHRKLPALTETGQERLPDASWWTKTLLPLIADYQLSYVLVWRNGRPDHYYAPYPGQASAADFQAFAKDKKVLMEKQIAPLKIYSKNL
ncbi:MAG: glycosyl hydrolase [Hymenobacter sp.]